MYSPATDTVPVAISAEDDLEREAQKPVLLAPIRVELDTETHRIRDYFTWNVNGADGRFEERIAD